MRIFRCLPLLALAACGGSDAGTPPRTSTPTTITIAPVTGAIESIGDTRSLTATVLDASGAAMPDATVTWSTSDQSIVAVSPASGATTTLTSRGNGNATVTASSSPATTTMAFAVTQHMASLAVSPAQVTVAPGATTQLTAAALDAHGTAIAGATGASFQSGNTGAATVDAGGLVHGVAAGSAIITASLTRDGVTRTATSTVTVGDNTQTYPTTAVVAATTQAVFNPGAVDIAAGGTVTWNFAGLAHNVTFDFVNGVPASISSQANSSASRTFPVAGTFSYECTIHPGMTGTVIVH